MSEEVEDTTMRIRRAVLGDPADLEWMVERFSPLLRAQAVYRLGPVLVQRLDPDDLVAEAWLVTLPRLPDLEPRLHRFTPVLLRFLASVVNNLANARMRSFLRQRIVPNDEVSPEVEFSASLTGVVTRAAAQERAQRIARCIAGLDEAQRQVVILRGIEGRSNEEIAELSGELPNTIAQRYRRALQKLRQCLPESVFDEFEEG